MGVIFFARKQTEVLGDGIPAVFKIAYKVHRAEAFATYAVKFSAFISTLPLSPPTGLIIISLMITLFSVFFLRKRLGLTGCAK